MAELRVFFCEYGTFHKDGTFTLVRGGIEHWTVERLPLDFRLFGFIEVPAGLLPNGPHPLSISLTSGAGLGLWNGDGHITIADPGKPVRAVVGLAASVQAYGPCVLEVRCGDLVGRAQVDIRPPEAQD